LKCFALFGLVYLPPQTSQVIEGCLAVASIIYCI
jgi:hypothetical protein